MHHLAAAAGARFERRGGWEIAVAYGSDGRAPALSFADRSHLTKLELHAEPATLARIVSHASGGLAPELGMAGRSAGTWWCPVTPSRLLVLSEPAHAPGVGAAIREAAAEAADTNVSVIDVTCGLAALALVGAEASELLARFSAIDVRPNVTPVAGFRPGSVARTPGYVLKEAEDRLLVMFGSAFGEYVWEVVADAAEHLGGGPIGANALPTVAQTEEPARA
jgi:heterotetrameric sarcosine oxidase gamma subunit